MNHERILIFLVFGAFLIWVCEAEELPDLIVSDIRWMPLDLPEENCVAIIAAVRNVGGVDTYRNFRVYFYINERYVRDDTLEGLRAGETRETSINWTVRPGNHNVYVKVDGEMYGDHGDIPESDENNNDLEISFNPHAAISTRETATHNMILLSFACPDKTSDGGCSTIKPGYCEKGTLVDKCSLCGCPPDRECQPDGSCKAPVEKALGIFTALLLAAIFSFVSNRKIKTAGMKRLLLIVTVFATVFIIVFIAL